MKTYTLINIFIILMLASCTGNQSVHTLLDEARVTARYSPSDAYEFLLNHKATFDKGNTDTRMHYYLLLAEIAYEASTTMPSDTICHQVVDYFDISGSTNEQIKANYVMGLKYLTMQSAPEAMQYFYMATDKARNPDASALDYETLMSLYNQMSQLLHYQEMYDTEIEVNNLYSDAADHLDYTYESIMGQERNIEAHIQLGDTTAALEQIERVSNLYADAGYDEQAVATYTHAIPIYISRGKYHHADSLMQQVRSKSGIFNDDGTLLTGHELYYQTIARYHYATGHTDSATYYYKRLFNAGYKLNACRGLLAIYNEQHPTDYISQLFSTYIIASDHMKRMMAGQEIHKLSYLYNYKRFQRQAEEKAVEAERARITAIITGIIILMAVVGAIVWFIQYRRRQSRQRQALQLILDEQYRRSEQYQADRQREINDAEMALRAMTNENQQLKDMMEAERVKPEEQLRTINEQKHMLDIHKRQLQLDQERQNLAENNFFDSGIYGMLRQHLDAETLLSDDQWSELEQRILQVYPSFHDKLYSLYQFSETEYRICLLTKIKVSPSNMALLMATSKSSISLNRSRMYRKVFHKAGSPEEWDDFIMSID